MGQGDRDQLARRVELHEARTPANGTPEQRRDRQQRVGRCVDRQPGIGSYIASKHGVVGLTRTAALEYIKQGIRVNAVNPGLIDTPVARDVVSGDEQAYTEICQRVPIGRAGRPEEIASAVLGYAPRVRATSWPCTHRRWRHDSALTKSSRSASE